MERDIAQETLAAIDSDQDQMARRTVMPSWYHAAVAVCCAAFIGSTALPDGTRTVAFCFVALVWVLLMLYPARRSGVTPRTWDGEQIALAALLLVVLVLLIVAANALVAWGSVWWVVVPTLLAAAFGWWMSLTSQRRFARRLRDGR